MQYRHVLAQLDQARCYLDQRAGPIQWWRATRIEGAWGHIHNATVALIDVATKQQLLMLGPHLLGVINGNLRETDPERRAIQPWYDQLPRVKGPPLMEQADRPRDDGGAGDPGGTASTGEPSTGCPDGDITDQARGALAAALRTTYGHIAAEYYRLRRFQWTIFGSAGVTLMLVAALAIVGWRNPEMVPLCFPDPDAPADAAATPADAETSDDQTAGADASATAPATRPPVCPSYDRPAPAPAPAETEGADTGLGQADGDRDSSPSRRADVLTVLLFGFVGASLTSVLFVVRQAPPTRVPVNGIRVAQGVLKAALGMLSAVIGLLFLRSGVVPGFTQIDTRSQVLMYAVLFGAAQQVVTRFIDNRSNELIKAVDPVDPDSAT